MLTYRQYLLETVSWTPKEAFEITKASSYVHQDILDAIKKSPQYTYLYALEVVRGPWKEGEPTLLKNPQFAYQYAYNILGHPWEEAEPYIKDSMPWAQLYAIYILHDRWPEAEKAIKSRPKMWEEYLTKLYYYPHINERSDWSTHEVDDLSILLELLQMFPRQKSWNITFDLQKEVLGKRPDLVGVIKNLAPILARKFTHEVELGNVDL
jgi:hypothetical protein